MVGVIILPSVISSPSPGPSSSHSFIHKEDPFSYQRTWDLTQQKVVFTPIGRYATDVTFVHISLKVPFHQYEEHFQMFLTDFDKIRTQLRGPYPKKSIERSLMAIATPVNLTITKFYETLVKLPEVPLEEAKSDGQGRYKRQLDLILAGATSVIGYVWEFFKQQEINTIKRDLVQLGARTVKVEDRTNLLMKTAVSQGEALRRHEKWIQANSHKIDEILAIDEAGIFAVLSQFSGLMAEEVRVFADTCKFAQLGKLNPDQVPMETVHEIWDFIRGVEKERGLISPVERASDLFAMPISYMYNLDEKHLEFFIHVPMSRPEQILDMYEFLPFPMTMTSDRSRVALPRPGPYNVLAYNQDRQYQTLSTTELHGCFRLKRVHYCKQRQVLKTDWSKSCLSALYTKNQEAATRYCDFHIQPADERVFKMQGDNFLVYTSKDIIAERICGNQHEAIQIQEGSMVSVPSGCRMKLEEHQIYGEAGLSAGFETPKIFEWSWDAKRVLRNLSGTDLSEAIQAMEHEAGMSSFETEDLLQQRELQQLRQEIEQAETETHKLQTTVTNPFQLVYWIAPLIASLGTFTTTFLILAIIKWWLRNRRCQRGPTPSAPAGPAIMMQGAHLGHEGHLVQPPSFTSRL